MDDCTEWDRISHEELLNTRRRESLRNDSTSVNSLLARFKRVYITFLHRADEGIGLFT